MDQDPDEVYEDAQKFEQVYELDLTVTPVSGIEVKAGLKGTNVFNLDDEKEIELDSSIWSWQRKASWSGSASAPFLSRTGATLLSLSTPMRKTMMRTAPWYVRSLGFPSDVSVEAVFERLIVAEEENGNGDDADGGDDEEGGEDGDAGAEQYEYFGGLRAAWQVNENMRLGGAVLGRMDSVTEKDEEADFLYAFNTELNLGNLGIAGEYAIHENGLS